MFISLVARGVLPGLPVHPGGLSRGGAQGGTACLTLRPVRLLRVSMSEGLTQANSSF